MDFSNLIRVEYRGEKVLSTRQVADAYGCTVQNIRANFSSAKEQFIEGIHYFKLEGAELAEFKVYIRNLKAKMSDSKISAADDSAENLPCTKLASSLFLWTKEGVIRHCKMLGTEKAWEVFGMLEKSYFGKMQAAQSADSAEQSPIYTNDNPPPFWQLLKIIRDRLLIKFAEKILGEKLF